VFNAQYPLGLLNKTVYVYPGKLGTRILVVSVEKSRDTTMSTHWSLCSICMWQIHYMKLCCCYGFGVTLILNC